MQRRVTFALSLYATCLLINFIANPSATRAQSTPEDLQPPPVAQISPAPASDFDRGLMALKSEQYSEAADLFAASYKVDQNPAALLNLGIAYANLGLPENSAKALRSYLEHSAAARDEQTTAAVKAELERLHTENGVIQLHLVPDVAEVQLDDSPIAVEQGELLVSPGKHRLTVRAEGYLPFDQTFDVQPGRFRLEVQLAPTASAISSAAAAAAAPDPTPAAEPIAPALREPTDEPEASAANGCAISQVCMGPVVSLLGPPNLFGGGLHVRIGRYLGAGVDYQVLPNVNVNPVTVGASLVSANARVYPFGGAFFLGGGFGYQAIRAQIQDGDIAFAAKAGFPAATANIGFMGHDGFVLGADIGVLFPLGTQTVSVHDMNGRLSQAGASQAQLDTTKHDAQARMSQLLDMMPVFMQVNLIRVGYLF